MLGPGVTFDWITFGTSTHSTLYEFDLGSRSAGTAPPASSSLTTRGCSRPGPAASAGKLAATLRQQVPLRMAALPPITTGPPGCRSRRSGDRRGNALHTGRQGWIPAGDRARMPDRRLGEIECGAEWIWAGADVVPVEHVFAEPGVPMGGCR
jgi:hypothetical protein